MPAFLPPPLATRTRNRLPAPAHRHRRATRRTPRAELSSALVVGANRSIGLSLAKLLGNTTPSLHTTYRADPPPALRAHSAATHQLDALDDAAVRATLALARPEVLISCIGGRATDAELPDFVGNRHLIDAALESGVRRFVLVSALGAGATEGSVPAQVMDTMRPLLLEKSHAERYLREVGGAGGLEWVIVRPGPLVDEAVGEVAVTEGVRCYGTVSRDAVASVLAMVCESDKVVGKELQVVDKSAVLITSPYVRPLEFWEKLPFEEFVM